MRSTSTIPDSTNHLIRPLKAQDISAIQRIAELAWRAHYPGIISVQQIEYMLGWMNRLIVYDLGSSAVAQDERARAVPLLD